MAAEELEFDERHLQVTRPLRLQGEFTHRGWDIPTHYAIDGAGKCWADNAHGPTLAPRAEAELLAEMEAEGHEGKANTVRKALGYKEEEPLWMRQARQAGWRPPEG